MIKLVLFDLDNTLYPTFEQVTKCRKKAIKAMIKRGLTGENLFEELKKIVKDLGSNSESHFDKLVKNKVKKEEVIPIVSAGVTAYNTTKQKIMKLYKDAKPTLNKIKKKHQIGILTQGNPKKQWDKINRLGLYESINKNVWIVNDNESKEDKIRKLIKKIKIKPEEIVLVGDRQKNDVLAANNTGIISIQLMKGPYRKEKIKGVKPKYKIRTLKELLELGILNQ